MPWTTATATRYNNLANAFITLNVIEKQKQQKNNQYR